MDYESMTVAELKDLLRDAGLPVSGRKAELIARLQDAGDTPAEAEEVEEMGDDEEIDVEEDEFESEDLFEDDWDDFHTARQKPVLDDATKSALATRAAQKKKAPTFRRQEWFRYKRLSRTGWKKPRGDDSSQRKNRKYRSALVRVGHGKIAGARGLHPSGFEEVLVNKSSDLEGLDPETQAVRIAATVGNRKRAAIHDRADDLGLRVLNRRRISRKGDLR
ncbi:MAG: 50S ribosomal protein L32e [Candidatus Thermoplasmatota archaeon]|nr:50S ribosomal protein L32e [Candidatus Thermoplasmatota archaeon]